MREPFPPDQRTATSAVGGARTRGTRPGGWPGSADASPTRDVFDLTGYVDHAGDSWRPEYDDDHSDGVAPRAGGRGFGGSEKAYRPPSTTREARDSGVREWHEADRRWHANRQVAERITVQRVALRLEAQRLEHSRARQLKQIASLRARAQREAEPSEWRMGERRWRDHRAQVESAVQAKTAERLLAEQASRLTAELSRVRRDEENEERRREEHDASRRHRAIAQLAEQAASKALADERKQQAAAFKARERQRLAVFEANVQRKRLGLPRLETEDEPGLQEFGLARIRGLDTLPVLAAAAGLGMYASSSRPVTVGGSRGRQGARSAPRLLALK